MGLDLSLDEVCAILERRDCLEPWHDATGADMKRGDQVRFASGMPKIATVTDFWAGPTTRGCVTSDGQVYWIKSYDPVQIRRSPHVTTTRSLGSVPDGTSVRFENGDERRVLKDRKSRQRRVVDESTWDTYWWPVVARVEIVGPAPSHQTTEREDQMSKTDNPYVKKPKSSKNKVLAVGDKVQHLSGGPVMAIYEIYDYTSNDQKKIVVYSCRWWLEERHHGPGFETGTFRRAELVLMPKS